MTIDPSQQQAIDSIEAGHSVFLSGRAGSGKSFTVHYWSTQTTKNYVLLASTGVAAVHIGGQTIHSFFGIEPGALIHEVQRKASRLAKQKQAIIKAVETFVIDEVSMVRADLLDCVDATLQIVLKDPRPFGGKQIVMVGDVYQLPPVVKAQEKELFSGVSSLGLGYSSPYFFAAHAFSRGFAPQLILLEHNYRQQQDSEFLDILNAIRNKRITPTQLATLNQRVEPDALHTHSTAVYLAGTNAQATRLNEQRLKALEHEERSFEATHWGAVNPATMPVEPTLRLKVGARVMIVRNDQPHLGRWVNGTTGTVEGFFVEDSNDGSSTKGVEVRKDDDGRVVKIPHCSWEVYAYTLRNERVERELIGCYTQIPLRLAWALTIHKAQGKTFQQVIVDLSRATFAYGQIYVALSRCTRLQGISLTRPLQKNHISVDPVLTSFIAHYHIQQARQTQSWSSLVQVIRTAIATNQPLGLRYLRSSDNPVTLCVHPLALKQIQYKGAMHHCLVAREAHHSVNRNFNLGRTLGATIASDD